MDLLRQHHANLLKECQSEVSYLKELLSSLYYKRSQRYYKVKKFSLSITDVNSAISSFPLSELRSQFFLLKGMSLVKMCQFADASSTFMQGLKIEPYDVELKRQFDASIKLMHQQRHYHRGGDGQRNVITTAPSQLYDTGNSSIQTFGEVQISKTVNPDNGFRDKRWVTRYLPMYVALLLSCTNSITHSLARVAGALI